MKENLFSRATPSTFRKWHLVSIFFKLILLTLWCIPCFYGAHELIKTDSLPKPQGTIFVSGNATIHGVSQISNAKVINLPPKVFSPQTTGSKKQDTAPKKQSVTAKHKENKPFKNLRREIDRKVKSHSYSSSRDSDLIRLSQLNGIVQIAGTGYFFKLNKAALSRKYISFAFLLWSAPQIISASFADHQSDHPIIFFLRGPPLSAIG